MISFSKVIALEAACQILKIEMKSEAKSYEMPVDVVFWKWISVSCVGIVPLSSVNGRGI